MEAVNNGSNQLMGKVDEIKNQIMSVLKGKYRDVARDINR